MTSFQKWWRCMYGATREEIWEAARKYERERFARLFDRCKNNQFTGPGIAQIIRNENWGYME